MKNLYFHNNKLFEFIFDLIQLTKFEYNTKTYTNEKFLHKICKYKDLLRTLLTKMTNVNIIDYLCVAIHNNFFNDKYDDISNLNYIFEFLKSTNKIEVFVEFYRNYLLDRYLRSTHFNLELEKQVLETLDIDTNADLTQIFSDIENSILCTKNLHNVTIIQKASQTIVDVKKLKPYYIANINEYERRNIKLKIMSYRII